MSDENKTKYEVLTKLQNGASISTLAEQYGISQAKILRWKREFKEAVENNDLNSILDVDRVVLGQLVDQVKENALTEEVGQAADKVLNGVDGLNKLSVELQTTASILNQRIKSLALSIESISELQMLTECLCSLQSSFFNKNLTQVNVQNNYGDNDNTYSSFLSDKPAS